MAVAIIKEQAGDGLPVLVGSPQITRRRLGAFEIELDIVFLGKSHPTVQLDTGAGAEEGGIPCRGRQHPGCLGEFLGARRSGQPLVRNTGRVAHQRSSAFDLHHHVRSFMLDGLVRGNGAAKLHPIADILNAVVETGLGAAHLVSTHHNPGQIKDHCQGLCPVRAETVIDNCLSADWAESLAVVLDLTRIMVGADQVGCAQASLDHSIQYVSDRVQFGRTIASYQAIKHKAADMMVKVECARSLMCYAACVADEWLAGAASTQELAEAARMLASSAGDAAFFCAGTGIQLHGGVGLTEEYDIQLYFKRAQATAGYLGRPYEHRETIARLLLDDGDSHAA